MLLFKRTHRVCCNQIYLSGTLSCVVTQAVIHVQGVYAKLQHDEGVTRVYVPRFFVSSQQRFGVTDIKAPSAVTALGSWRDRVIALRSRMDHVIALRQISVTAQCYSSILFRRQQENPSLRHEGMSTQRLEEKSTPAHWLLFSYVYLSLGLSYVN